MSMFSSAFTRQRPGITNRKYPNPLTSTHLVPRDALHTLGLLWQALAYLKSITEWI